MIPALALVIFVSAPSLAQPQFVDRAGDAGLNVVTYCGGPEKNHILESTGTGVVVFDYDSDGFPDVYFVNAHRFTNSGREPHSGALYRNRGDGTFEDTTHAAGVVTSIFGQGGAAGDIDADGLLDLYVTAFGANVLFRNNGDGTFSDWTTHSAVSAAGWSIGASFFDADADGDQDLFVGSYIEATWEEVHEARRTRKWRGRVEVLDGPRGLPAAANVFLRNRGDGTFEEEPIDDGTSHYSMGVLPLDYDLDGDVDVYVANDSSPNALHRNDGTGHFEDVAAEAGVAFSADGKTQGSMGVDAGDLDNDGFPDLVVTNFAHDYYAIYRNLEGSMFLDESFSYGVALPSFAPLGWGALLFDADLDTDLDLFFANGHIYPQVEEDASLGEGYGQKNQLLLLDGARFVDATESAGPGFEVTLSSRGAAAADFDLDGDVDIVVSNEDAKPSFLINASEPGRWVAFRLAEPVLDRMSVGARVVVESGGVRQSRAVLTGGSYASQSDTTLHFGLGRHDIAELVTIHWTGGRTSTYERLPAGRVYVVKPGVEPIALVRDP